MVLLISVNSAPPVCRPAGMMTESMSVSDSETDFLCGLNLLRVCSPQRLCSRHRSHCIYSQDDFSEPYGQHSQIHIRDDIQRSRTKTQLFSSLNSAMKWAVFQNNSFNSSSFPSSSMTTALACGPHCGLGPHFLDLLLLQFISEFQAIKQIHRVRVHISC